VHLLCFPRSGVGLLKSTTAPLATVLTSPRPWLTPKGSFCLNRQWTLKLLLSLPLFPHESFIYKNGLSVLRFFLLLCGRSQCSLWIGCNAAAAKRIYSSNRFSCASPGTVTLDDQPLEGAVVFSKPPTMTAA